MGQMGDNGSAVGGTTGNLSRRKNEAEVVEHISETFPTSREGMLQKKNLSVEAGFPEQWVVK